MKDESHDVRYGTLLKGGVYIEKCETQLEDTVKEQYLNIIVLLWRQ